jgi:anthranilate synthase/aminodeoxychorismate synthase-like glutamine amidotransferase
MPTGQAVVVVDNYDSFTYNLVQYLGELGADVRVHRNDQLDLSALARQPPDRIVISPGPGRPAEAGVSLAVIARFAGVLPILGVCLGHQAIGQAFGARIGRAPEIVHGKASKIHHDARGVYAGIENPLTGMRYHSLVVERESLPACLQVSAWTREGLVMGIRHREYAVEGIQFHPESILTPCGRSLLAKFLRQ